MKSWIQNHFNFSLFVLCLLLGGVLAAVWQQENYWDLIHYHLYNPWAFWHDKTWTNIAPAHIHSYFNPFADMPMYFFWRFFNDMPRIAFFYQGMWFGALVFLTIKLYFLLFPHHTKTDKASLGCAIVFGLLGHGIFSQIGTSTNEMQLAVLFLTVFYFLVKKWFVEKENLPFFVLIGLGMVLGALCGLKYTVAPMILGLGVSSLIFIRHIPNPIKTGLGLAFGFLAGFLIANGYWMYQLWVHLESPVYPFLNQIFQSPYFPSENFQDPRFSPKSISEWLFFPFYWLNPYQISANDVWFSGVQMCAAYSAVFVMIFHSLFRKTHISPAIKFIFVYWGATYIIWLGTLSHLRYAIPLEVLTGILILTLLTALLKNTVNRLIFMLFLVVALIVVSCLYYRSYNGSVVSVLNRSRGGYIAWVEPIQIPDDTVVLLTAPFSFSYMAGLWNPNLKFAGYHQDMERGITLEKTRFQKEMVQELLKPGAGFVVVGSFVELLSVFKQFPEFDGMACAPLATRSEGVRAISFLGKEYYPRYICPPPDSSGKVAPMRVSDFPQLKAKLEEYLKGLPHVQ